MAHRRLDNYLRTYRKRLGLSQREVALLLGARTRAHVSRWETDERLPSLETALAYEALLGVPVAELFAGRFDCMERRIAIRAKLLEAKLRSAGPRSFLDFLTSLANRFRDHDNKDHAA